MKKLKVQVNKENYDFSRYVNMDRWSSYYYQIEAAMNSKGNDILLIGAEMMEDLPRKLNYKD